jgi:hypothetical protein
MQRWANGTGTFALWDDPQTGRFSAVSSSMPDGNTIATVVRAGESGVEIRQTIAYENGRPYYDLRWDIVNTGGRRFSDVRFCHGGDVSPYGEDFVREGEWNPASNLVYVLAQDGRMMGLRGMDPAAVSYGEDHFELIREACKAGDLPGTAKGVVHDGAYALQWRRESLGPEETWTITAREIWTGADLQEESVWTNITPYLAGPLFTWQLNRQTGTYFGELTLRQASGGQGGMYCTGPFWCVLASSEIRRYWPHPSGTTPAGMEYTNLTSQVESGLSDGQLDPGDEVMIPGVQIYMRYRQPPPDSAFTIWATLHGGAAPE